MQLLKGGRPDNSMIWFLNTLPLSHWTHSLIKRWSIALEKQTGRSTVLVQTASMMVVSRGAGRRAANQPVVICDLMLDEINVVGQGNPLPQARSFWLFARP
jgi:hypothetical protein